MASRTKEIVSVLCVLAVTLFFCLFHIKESPPVWYDEGIYMQAASNMADHVTADFQVAPGIFEFVPQLSVGYPLLKPLAIVFSLHNMGVLQARLLMTFFVIALVLLVYATLRMLFGVRSALWAIILLALFPPFYGTGKSVLGEVPGTAYFFLGGAFLAHALITKAGPQKILRLIGAGLGFGLTIVTKPVFILLVPALFIAGCLKWRTILKYKKEFTIGMCSLILPVAVWLFVQFGATGSLTMVLAFYANPSQVQDLWGTVFSNFKHFFTDLGPVMLLVTVVVWSFSIFIRWKRQIRIHFIESTSFLLTIISLAAFLRTAGYYRYLLPYQIISLAFFPASLETVWHWIQDRMKHLQVAHSRFIRFIPAKIFILMCLLGVYQLFFSSWMADSYKSTRTDAWEKYFSETELRRPIFFYDVPEVAIFDHDRNYYQYINMAPAAGISVGSNERGVIVQGIPATVITKSEDVVTPEHDIFRLYHKIVEVDKYTILEKL